MQGDGVGLFTMPKFKRLVEDESLRALACARINTGLDRKHASEDEFLDEIVLFNKSFLLIVLVKITLLFEFFS